MRRRANLGARSAIGSALILLAAACGGGAKDGEGSPAAKPTDATLAAEISSAPGLAIVSAGLKSTGLGTVFDGAAPYTLLAPDDDAFGALGAAGTALQQPQNTAALAAILRDHILPGYVTVSDIEAALKASGGKPVKMKTMGDSEVSFSREDDALIVSTADGARARIDSTATPASNGVVIPIDAVLRQAPKTTA